MKIGVSIAVVSSVWAVDVSADCFDEPMLISRYFYPNPASVSPNWQDIYVWTAGTAAARLSTGAFPSELRDYNSFAPIEGSTFLFKHAAGGGTDSRIDKMDAVDIDGNMQGDNRLALASSGIELSSIAYRAGKVVTSVLDDNGDAQVGVADLSGNVLSGFVMLTDDLDYPDGYDFIDDTWVAYSINGNGLRFLNLVSGTSISANTMLPISRSPTLPDDGSRIVFSALQDGNLDLFIANVLPGPSLGAISSLTQTADLAETSAAFSPDGNCLAWLSTPSVDVNGDPVSGPYTDVFVRDLTTSEEMQLTTSRDIGQVGWLRP